MANGSAGGERYRKRANDNAAVLRPIYTSFSEFRVITITTYAIAGCEKYGRVG
jgi:hypothetical protein